MVFDKDQAGYSCIRYAFGIYNILILLVGCAVLSLGIWVLCGHGTHEVLPDYTFTTAAALIIFIGAVIAVSGFLGFCGALVENQCMLVSYFTFVLTLFLLEVAVLSIFFTKKSEIKSLVEEELASILRERYSEEPVSQADVAIVSVVDRLQQDLECCGVNNHTDWYDIDLWPGHHFVPDSCCVERYTSCGRGSSPLIWERGCETEVEYWFIRNMYVFGVVGVSLVAVQILGLVVALMLFCCLRQKKDL